MPVLLWLLGVPLSLVIVLHAVRRRLGRNPIGRTSARELAAFEMQKIGADAR